MHHKGWHWGETLRFLEEKYLLSDAKDAHKPLTEGSPVSAGSVPPCWTKLPWQHNNNAEHFAPKWLGWRCPASSIETPFSSSGNLGNIDLRIDFIVGVADQRHHIMIITDHGWFFKPQLFPIKIILLKRGTLQLSNAKKFSSIRQGTTKLQEFKVERFWESFVTVTMGKSRFDGTERLAFRPWQRFICIHSDVGAGDRRRPICFFSPFGSSCALCTGLVSFVRTQDEGAMCPKITISMIPEILKLANSVGPGDV